MFIALSIGLFFFENWWHFTFVNHTHISCFILHAHVSICSFGKLQTALNLTIFFAILGESPSSSASDVDNLNNQIILGKNASTKAVSSPQVAGSHVIAARHHHQVMRLLHYVSTLGYYEVLVLCKCIRLLWCFGDYSLRNDHVAPLRFCYHIEEAFSLRSILGLSKLMALLVTWQLNLAEVKSSY